MRGAAMLGLLAWTAASTSAGAAEDPPWQVLLQWDNDLLTNTDRDYTNGARLAFQREFAEGETTNAFLSETLFRLSGAAREGPLRGLRFAGSPPYRFAWGMGLTQLMFTPEDYEAPAPPPGERPYAGWLGLEVSLHVKADDAVSSVTLSAGTTGSPSLAEEVQGWVHDNISNSPRFRGWDSQVPAEPTLNLHFDHKRRLGFLDRLLPRPLELDGYAEWGGALGNFRTDAYSGLLARAGFNLPAVHSTPRVQLGSFGHALFRPEGRRTRNPSAFAFAGVRGSAVGRDITLGGPLFSSFEGGVDPEPLVGEAVLGAGFAFGQLAGSFSLTYRTDEFKGQKENQRFGSVMLRLRSAF